MSVLAMSKSRVARAEVLVPKHALACTSAP